MAFANHIGESPATAAAALRPVMDPVSTRRVPTWLARARLRTNCYACAGIALELSISFVWFTPKRSFQCFSPLVVLEGDKVTAVGDEKLDLHPAMFTRAVFELDVPAGVE